MDREQIIKALECCTRSGCSDNETKDCPLKPYEDCTTRLATNALALITSQEQTIKELTEENERLLTALARYDQQTEVRIAEEYYTAEAYEELREENERLKKHEIVYETPFGKQTMPDILSLDGKSAELYKRIENKIKADTVRKMHSLIKERCIKGGIYPAFVESTIEKVANELLGGD
jgi:hypothetical protein